MKRIAFRNYMAKNKALKNSRSSQLQLGIVGGGQLAQMLALEAAPLGIQVHILSEKERDPAVQVCKNWQKGNPNSRKDVIEFSQKLDLLTFESEFYEMTSYFEIQEKALQGASLPLRQESPSLSIFPSPEAMQILQNRSSQKAALIKAKIPVAPSIEVNTKEDLTQAWQKFPKGFVLKKCRGGYDGYGTYYCQSQDDLVKLHALFPAEFIAEPLISFKRELAVTLIRSQDGSLETLPLVESHQEQSRCDWVIGPVKHKKLSGLLKKISHLLQQLNYVGCVSFELFDTGTELLVNEVAPRVHNSAHYSQEALSHSQFLLHVLAGLGEKFPKVKLLSPAFCMSNLVGQSNEPAEIPCNLSGHLHWYGKDENRVGRKMGHVNYTGAATKELLKKALLERKKFKL